MLFSLPHTAQDRPRISLSPVGGTLVPGTVAAGGGSKHQGELQPPTEAPLQLEAVFSAFPALFLIPKSPSPKGSPLPHHLDKNSCLRLCFQRI